MLEGGKGRKHLQERGELGVALGPSWRIGGQCVLEQELKAKRRDYAPGLLGAKHASEQE